MARGDIINKIHKDLSLRHRLDKRVIREITFHPLLFSKRMIESGDDKAIMIRYFGKFVPKTTINNKTNAMKYIYKTLSDNLEELYGALPEDYYDIFDKKSKLKKELDIAFNEKNKPFLDKLYIIYKENIKNA